MIVFAQPIEQFPQRLAIVTVPVFSAGADANFPSKNLLSYDRTQVARTTANSVQINWDFGRNRKFDVVSLIDSNIGVRGIWTISGSTDGTNYVVLKASDAFWAHIVGTVATIPAGAATDEDLDPRRTAPVRNSSFFYSQSTVYNYRYLRIQVSDADAGTGMTFGRLFVGRVFRPKTSYQYGSRLIFDDSSNRERTDQGALILDPGRTIVGASVKMDFLSTNEVYDFIYDFNYWRGSARELLCCLDVNTPARLSKNLLYATITEGRTVTADQFEAWSQTWTLESI